METKSKIIIGSFIIITLIGFVNFIFAATGDFITNWDTSGQTGIDIYGIDTDNEYIWITDDNNNRVWKYFMNGTYTTDNWATTGANARPWGLAYYDGRLWIPDIVGNAVHQYYTNGTYINAFNTVGQSDETGITTNGTFIWVSDAGQDKIFKYYMNGTAFDSFAVSSDAWDVAYTTDFLWVLDRTAAEVYKWFVNGTDTGISFDISVETASPRGMGGNETFFWIADRTDREVYVYEGPGELLPEDTCTYSSGIWEINCADYCNITTNTDTGSDNIIVSGTGSFTILANITTNSFAYTPGCNIINAPNDGKELRIKGGG